MKKYLAEMVGTMVLVLMGCGSAVFAGNIALLDRLLFMLWFLRAVHRE